MNIKTEGMYVYNKFEPDKSPIVEEEIEKETKENNVYTPLLPNLGLIPEENFGVSNQNLFNSFNTFNSSHVKDDQSFLDGSFNTMLNLNTELNEAQKDLVKNLKEDLEPHKLPNNLFKFRICYPAHGQMICKQHIVDLSSIKVVGSSQTSLGKIFTPKKSYLDYMLENLDTVEEK
uniref:Uncharacterized protein n=1 Tax=Euplotes harpa TaxID=151035 RepID=A0A7S3J4X1_9SPIT|mmetsp:Transcript_1675/g.2087  ORF Transcript_1675/g.2087 Transcript_1675/m.2087 type:complete len:175 (+) Transcript_1675:239-763(+)